MCELLVIFSDFVTFCAVVCCVIDLKRPGDTGLSVANFVKCMKCLTGISLKDESVINNYRLFSIRWVFLPGSIVVFGWNIVEFVLLHYEKEGFRNHTVYIFIWIILFAMLAYLVTLIFIVSRTSELEKITLHQIMLMIYHFIDTIVDLTMIIATHESRTIDPGLNWKFAIFIFSICDIIQSSVQFIIIMISLFISCLRKNSVQPENWSRNQLYEGIGHEYFWDVESIYLWIIWSNLIEFDILKLHYNIPEESVIRPRVQTVIKHTYWYVVVLFFNNQYFLSFVFPLYILSIKFTGIVFWRCLSWKYVWMCLFVFSFSFIYGIRNHCLSVMRW